MAIAFDNAVDGGSGSGNLSWTHVCTGSDLIIFVITLAEGGSDTVTGVTYNGVALTKLQSQSYGSITRFLDIWYLINPTAGSHTVGVTKTGGAQLAASSSSYTGVNQSNPIDTSGKTQSNSITTQTLSLTTTVNNAWMVIGAAGDAQVPTAGTGSTVRISNQPGIWDSNAALTPAGSHSMSVVYNPATNAAIVGAAFSPVASGPANVKTFDGVTQSTGIKTYFGVDLANIKTVDGIA